MPARPRPALAPDLRLTRFLRHWLLAGAALVLLVPAARGHGEWLGWLPFWLCLAPAASLLALHRARVGERARIGLMRLRNLRRKRCRTRARGQARRLTCSGPDRTHAGGRRFLRPAPPAFYAPSGAGTPP